MNSGDIARFLRHTCVVQAAILAHGLFWRSIALEWDWSAGLARDFLRLDVPAAGLWLVIVGAVLAWQKQIVRVPWERWADLIASRRGTVGALALVVMVGICVVPHQGRPYTMDEAAHLFQARLFAEGRVWAEFEPEMLDWVIPPLVQQHHFTTAVERGWVVAKYWPGFSLLLTPFVWLGVPWLLNPLLGGLVLLLIAELTRRLTDSHTASAIALLLAVASPQLVVTAGSYYAMTAHLAANLGFALLLLEPTPRRAAVAGLLGGLAVALHQPLPHVLFAIPWIAWLAWDRQRWRSLCALLACYLPGGIAIGAGWTTVRAMLLQGEAIELGAGTSGTVLDAALRALRMLRWPDQGLLSSRIVELEMLLLWAVPGLPILALVGFWSVRARPEAKLLGASLLTTWLGYLLVPFDQWHGWGARYLHQAWGVLPILGAAVVAGPGGRRWVRVLVPLALASLVIGNGLRWVHVAATLEGQRELLPPLASGWQRHIVFIDTSRGYQRHDLVQNDPFLRNPVLVFSSQGRDRDEALVRARYPEARLVFESDNDSVWALAKVDRATQR